MLTSLFLSYSHKDEALKDKLATHLQPLVHRGLIEPWSDRRILAGDEFDPAIRSELNESEIILLLISPDFIASEYCFSIEMSRAMERHEAGEARVVPVILRPCLWQKLPFGKLNAVPKDGDPITQHADEDEAFTKVAISIEMLVEGSGASASHAPLPSNTSGPQTTEKLVRSANLGIKRVFTREDRDRFLDDSFEFIERYFENSLAELSTRHPEITTRFRKIDGNTFSAFIYRDGAPLESCKIARGAMMRDGICFSFRADSHSAGWNEIVNVFDDGYSLLLKPMGMPFFNLQTDQPLSKSGAADYLWSLLLHRLQ